MAYLKRVGKPEDFIDRSMEMDSKIVDACVNAVKESIESNRNELGIALAVIRALRDNDCLSLEKLECAMTREEVIGLARAAGLEGPMETGILEDGERFTSPFCYSPTPANCGWRLGDGVFMDDLENFTALVTAAEREVMNKEFEKLLSA
ncbi:hypothetical protein EBR78_08920, partial [bacterium]|nr:hypothetical protein [bacterium]